MSYDQWRSSYATVGETDARAQAYLWNLESETRIDLDCTKFRELLAELNEQHRMAGASPLDSAKMAIDKATGECRTIDSRWLGKLQLDGSAVIPESVVTHFSSIQLARDHTRAFVDPRNPPRRVQLYPLKTKPAGGARVPVTRFIWITWAPDGRQFSDDPTALRRELGLDHFRIDDFMFRCSITIDRTRHRLFVPTCLDAALNPPWKRPADPGSPWGMTRDLTDGQDRWPELLVEVEDCLDQTPVGELVSPSGSPPQAMGFVEVDYMIGRI